jgi:hypothetical protein
MQDGTGYIHGPNLLKLWQPSAATGSNVPDLAAYSIDFYQDHTVDKAN